VADLKAQIAALTAKIEATPAQTFTRQPATGEELSTADKSKPRY
jgi:hypothetical protein